MKYALFSVSAHGNELSTPATALIYVLCITGTVLVMLTDLLTRKVLHFLFLMFKTSSAILFAMLLPIILLLLQIKLTTLFYIINTV